MLILFIILVLVGSLYRKRESFYNFCKVSNFRHKKKFTPINMILNDIKPFKFNKNYDYVNYNLPIYRTEVSYILSKIPISKLDKTVKELPGVRYNLVDPPEINYVTSDIIDNLPNLLSTKLIAVFNKNMHKSRAKECNNINKCLVKKKDIRILKVGKTGDKYILEGQILLNIRHIDFLIRFVISNNNTLTIHYLKLEGFDFTKLQNNFNNNQHVNIYREPIINTYNADKTYLYSSNESKILDSTLYSTNPQDPEYTCYGKVAYNKYECEAKYDSNGKINKQIGIWDKPCNNNAGCPFYKKNKNYPNTFGGCLNGTCEMPTGTVTISPTKFIDSTKIICSNCKKGYNCCPDQYNTKLYPKLKSPDYRFHNDSYLREKYKL